MRHFRHIRNDRRAGNALAQRNRRRGFFAHHLRTFQHIAQGHGFNLLVRNLNADRRLSGNRRFNAHAVGRHVQRDIIDQTDDARNLDARCGCQLIARDGRSMRDMEQLSLYAKALKRADQLACARLVLGALVGILRRPALIEQVNRREDIFLLRRLRRFVNVLLRHDDGRSIESVSAELNDRLLLVHPLCLQNILSLRLHG